MAQCHTHTHTHTGRTGVAHAWVVAGVVTTTTPLVPHHHTHTQRDWWCGPWWCLVVRVCPVCASHATITLAFPPTTTTNALVPPPPSHTHTGLGACTTATHTHHMHHHTHQGVLCVDHTMPHPPPPTPSPHSHTHTPHGTHTRHQPHCHNGACHRSPRRPLTHTTDATHTTQETDQGQAHHWLWLFVSHHHHAGLALSLSCLLRFLSTIPFSLSQACTHTPLMCSSPPPCHPSRVWCCVVGMDSTKHHSGGEARHSHAC